jgi:hypothetical protein
MRALEEEAERVGGAAGDLTKKGLHSAYTRQVEALQRRIRDESERLEKARA